MIPDINLGGRILAEIKKRKMLQTEVAAACGIDELVRGKETE